MKEDFTDFIEVSGLLDYDPNTIAKIYKKNPKRLLKRLWQTLIPIFAYIFSVGWDKLTGRLKNEEQARFRARELTNLLVELGPAFVKAGQALSTRPDIIPGILLEELSELHGRFFYIPQMKTWSTPTVEVKEINYSPNQFLNVIELLNNPEVDTSHLFPANNTYVKWNRK